MALAEKGPVYMSRKIVKAIGTLFGLVKFEHTLFALPFAFMGTFLASGGWPSGHVVLWVSLAMVGARTSAMALNRLIDREIDARNPRTAGRHLPRGVISPAQVVVLAALALALLLFAAGKLNPLALALSPLAVVMIVVYPYTKRFTWLSHVLLGMVLGSAPVGGWIAVTGRWAWSPLFLSAGVTLWTAGFDIIYACDDYEFDRREGLYSIPAVFGIPAGLVTARVFHAVALALFAGAGYLAGLAAVYQVGVIVAGVLMWYEHSLVSPTDLSRAGVAFFNVNAAVSAVLFFFGVAGVFWPH